MIARPHVCLPAHHCSELLLPRGFSPGPWDPVGACVHSSWGAQGRGANCEFCVLLGEGGIDGDGDITRPENITAFRNFVLDNTDRKGVHFLMADGVGDLLFRG